MVIITADEGRRGGSTIGLKKNVDAALEDDAPDSGACCR